MKLLLDQNISYKLVTRLADVYPGFKHVRQIGLREVDGLAVWD
jgi:predicted nuclease of predicted toxin-antitoxin system